MTANDSSLAGRAISRETDHDEARRWVGTAFTGVEAQHRYYEAS